MISPDEVQKTLTESYETVKKMQESMMADAMSRLNDVKDEGMKKYLSDSLQKAKNGELNFKQFSEELKSRTNGN